MFAGGIRDRVLSLLTYEHVSSGFLPRFIFICADSNVKRLKPLGPPTEETVEKRYELLMKFANLHAHYRQMQVITAKGGQSVASPRRWNATLSSEAWARYNKFEQDMLGLGLESYNRDLVTPTFDRLAKSGLKMAVLIAASRMEGEEVVVELRDMLKAIMFIERWKVHSSMVINAVGKTAAEKQLERILRVIRDRPGILRSEVMQLQRLNAREAEAIFRTLEERNLVNRIRRGRTELLFAHS
jgi:hypothetical protein